MKKEEQKQHLIDMMRYDEELGLYKETEQMNVGAVSTRFIYDCGIKYAYELAKKENAELNVETAMMIAKDYTKHVIDFLSQNDR
jgi:hypothetical protein